MRFERCGFTSDNFGLSWASAGVFFFLTSIKHEFHRSPLIRGHAGKPAPFSRTRSGPRETIFEWVFHQRLGGVIKHFVAARRAYGPKFCAPRLMPLRFSARTTSDSLRLRRCRNRAQRLARGLVLLALHCVRPPIGNAPGPLAIGIAGFRKVGRGDGIFRSQPRRLMRVSPGRCTGNNERPVDSRRWRNIGKIRGESSGRVRLRGREEVGGAWARFKPLTEASLLEGHFAISPKFRSTPWGIVRPELGELWSGIAAPCDRPDVWLSVLGPKVRRRPPSFMRFVPPRGEAQTLTEKYAK